MMKHRGVRALPCLALLVAAAACSSGGRPAPRRVEVVMQQVRFMPDTVRLAPGDTVVWLNHDLFPHTASDTLGEWDSRTIEPGDSARTVITAAGTSGFLCRFHTTMTGVLISTKH